MAWRRATLQLRLRGTAFAAQHSRHVVDCLPCAKSGGYTGSRLLLRPNRGACASAIRCESRSVGPGGLTTCSTSVAASVPPFDPSPVATCTLLDPSPVATSHVSCGAGRCGVGRVLLIIFYFSFTFSQCCERLVVSFRYCLFSRARLDFGCRAAPRSLNPGCVAARPSRQSAIPRFRVSSLGLGLAARAQQCENLPMATRQVLGRVTMRIGQAPSLRCDPAACHDVP